MSRIKIEVNDGVLDLFDGTDKAFYITKQINDLHNLQNRQADFTRQISIPSTENNKELLNLETNERLSNPSYLCNILLNESLVIPYARLLIVNHSEVEISIVMFSGNFELFDSIPNESIQKLDLTSYNFPWTTAGLAALASNTSGAISVNLEWFDYDSTDPGTGVPNTIFGGAYRPLDLLGFGFHLKTLFSEICANAGFVFTELTGEPTNDDGVLICPVNIPAISPLSQFAKVDRSFTPFNYSALISLGNPEILEFNNVVNDASGLWTNYKFTIVNTNSYNVTAGIDYNYVTGAANPQMFFQILQGTNVISNYTRTTGILGGNQIMSIDLSLTAGDEISMIIFAAFQNNNNYDTIEIKTGSYFQVTEGADPISGDLVVSDWLPDINQRAFVADFALLMGAFINSNSFDKKVNLLTWEDYVLQTIQDLTANVDARQVIVNEASIDGYYRQSLMQYNNDNLFRTDLDYVVNFQNDDTLPLTGTILTSLFSGSDQNKSPVNPNRINPPYFTMSYNSASNFSITAASASFTFTNDENFLPGDWIFDGSNYYRISTVVSKKSGTLWIPYHATLATVDIQIVKITENDLTPRIGLVQRTGSNLQLTYNAFGPNTVPTLTACQEVYSCQTMTEIYTDYYKELFDALQTPKIVNIWMNFTVNAFIDLDMLKPVYIQELNGYFYINKIEQYKLDEPCRVELIRINKLI